MPYTKGLSDSFRIICSKQEIQVHFQGGITIKNLLIVHKDKDTITQKSGVILRYKCNRVECDKEYIGEFKASTTSYEHCNITGHHTSVDNFSIVESEL